LTDELGTLTLLAVVKGLRLGKRENIQVMVGIPQNLLTNRCIILKFVAFQNQKTVDGVFRSRFLLDLLDLALNKYDGFLKFLFFLILWRYFDILHVLSKYNLCLELIALGVFAYAVLLHFVALFLHQNVILFLNSLAHW
jgi:hypothetical protein